MKRSEPSQYLSHLASFWSPPSPAEGGQANDALLQAYGECLYENGVAQLAGLSSVDETVDRLRANVRNGSQTAAEFQRVYDKSCKG